MRYTGPNSLGQHILTDRIVIEQIIREAKLAKIEKVLESVQEMELSQPTFA
jgi:16S rRNA A1518/A1519 N6-dimethyltransferase RsmA/KsgA/DIM1 with predicted DNA glycosylase/AP lyase activity